MLDSGTPDSGEIDSGPPDAGQEDAGTPDAGQEDAGAEDAGAPDAGREDAGAADAGAPDAGPIEPYVGPFATAGESFVAWDAGHYRSFFVRAVNIGASRPGQGPRDITVPAETWTRWFNQMHEIGFNAVRLYSMQAPPFYETLRTFNEAHPDTPLLLIQGIYLSETHTDGTLDVTPLAAGFDAEVEEAIDCIHGNRVVAQRPGAAWGAFTTDVSPWTLAWLPGREVLGTEVVATDRLHPDDICFAGSRLRLCGTPTEAWMARRLDHLADYELNHYQETRPLAWSNWLELDPLRHPTEGRDSGKDIAQVDLGRVDPFGLPAGYYVSYHIYPYYPNFVSEDPVYRTYSDELGPNSYRGILEALHAYHAGTPLLVAEYGVPSSWGRAHTSYSGMHHGGLDEAEVGRYAARMLRDIHDVGMAGGGYFQWLDGWWKNIWITRPIAFPAERLPLWHDMMNAQEHYGLVAFDPDPPDFAAAPATTGTGRIREVRAVFDAEYVHLRVRLDQPLADGVRLYVGFDTYADDRGETLLPNRQRTTRRNEFVLTVVAPNFAELQVLRSYDLYSIRESNPPASEPFRSTASDIGDWTTLYWLIAAAHGSDDGSWQVPAENHAIGGLRTRRASDPATSLDGVVIDGDVVTIRVPWVLLNFSDPSRPRVIDDDRSTRGTTETATTSGIAFSVSLGNSLLETPRLGWAPWNQVPDTHERLKSGVGTFSAQVHALSGWRD